jgi:putative phage-type endonuclease
MTEQLEQGSPEWLAARVGKVTASRVADVCAKTKTGWGASRANYMAELIAERLTGQPAQQYVNAAMQWGTDCEPQARAAYEFMQDATVEQVGLVPHPSIPMSAASPDGYVDADGMLEIKCPNTATHVDTLLGQAVPEKYITQMQWQMACAGRKWCDFVSYDPRLPANLSLFVARVARDDKRIAELEAMVREFLTELDAKVSALLALNQEKAA